MRWAARQRQLFIAETLQRQGYINRSDLMTQFGISQPQASLDLQGFLRQQPGKMSYNRSQRRYDATAPADSCVRRKALAQ